MESGQVNIFGGVDLTKGIEVKKMAEQIMQENPMTFRSHRLLMLEVARRLGLKKYIDEMPSEMKHALYMLLDSSPNFERAARKIREESERSAKQGTPPPVEPAPEEYEDPFAAIEKENAKRHRFRRSRA